MIKHNFLALSQFRNFSSVRAHEIPSLCLLEIHNELQIRKENHKFTTSCFPFDFTMFSGHTARSYSGGQKQHHHLLTEPLHDSEPWAPLLFQLRTQLELAPTRT
ncbi:hypothetical protein ABZP36_031604 [Zizania latifolia]